MKKEFLSMFLAAGLAATLGLAACNQGGTDTASTSAEPEAETVVEETAEPEATTPAEEPAVDGAAYGYAGTDPVEAAVYKYVVEELGKNYDASDASIPVVQIVNVDDSDPNNVVVYGDFWINNYNIDGDTLSCVSGGNYPGVMHVSKDGGAYTVSSFDMVADGSGFEASARELFGDNYDAFMKVYSDDVTRAEQRTATVSDYVSLNGLEVTQYQDYGWDPVQINVLQ